MTILPPNPSGEANEPGTMPGAENLAGGSPVPPVAEPAPATAQQPPMTPPPAAPTAGQGAAHTVDPLSNIQINYWLSVFFTWIPALIFYFMEKDKGQSLAFKYHVANLNFSLLRTIVSIALAVLSNVPFIGWLFAIVLWLGSVVLFVFHIIAASKVSANYRAGKDPDFIFNLPLVK